VVVSPKMAAPAPYEIVEVEDSADGWGPSAEPEKLQGIPFAPFSKSDKLGKAADWTNQNFQKYSGAWPGRGGLVWCLWRARRPPSIWLLFFGSPLRSTTPPSLYHQTGRYSQNPVATVFTFFQNEEVREVVCSASGGGGGRRTGSAASESHRSLAGSRLCA
jgi:hypothetical protein